MARAYRDADPNLLEAYAGASGRKLVRAIRRSGQIFAHGNVYDVTGRLMRVKPGLTLAEIERGWRERHPDWTIRRTFAGECVSGPVVSEEKAAQRVAAQRVAARKRAAERERTKPVRMSRAEEAYRAGFRRGAGDTRTDLTLHGALRPLPD
jgi:hypothetical protein